MASPDDLASFAAFALAWLHTGMAVAVALCTVAALVTGVATTPLLAALCRPRRSASRPNRT